VEATGNQFCGGSALRQLVRSITTCAPAMASLRPSPVMLLTLLLGEASDDLVAVLAQNGDGLRADQAGAADCAI
jgi:hypothetical protein